MDRQPTVLGVYLDSSVAKTPKKSDRSDYRPDQNVKPPASSGLDSCATFDRSGEFDTQVTQSRTPVGWVRRLTVKRRDGREGSGWDVLQTIKNELLGPDALAIEF